MSNEESLGRRGAQTPNSSTSELNAQSFLVRQILATLSTSKVVKIIAVTNDGDLSPVGFVDVQPMVTQVDGDGQPFPHSVIFNIPYFRLQGGTNAVIIDPKVGDIGICVFSDRDISTVKETRDTAKPGSMRSFNAADGLYIGGVLNGMPEQFIMFNEGGIRVVSPTKIRFEAPVIELVAETSISSEAPTITVDASGSVVMTTPNVTASATLTAPLLKGTTDVQYAGKSAVAHKHTGGTIAGLTGTTV